MVPGMTAPAIALLTLLTLGCSFTLDLDSPDRRRIDMMAVVDCDDEERCNGIDDDCDTRIDEGTDRTCYTGPAGTDGVAACQTGVARCVAIPGAEAEAFGECVGQVVPDLEQCNGRDDDCDGAPDRVDGVAITQPCYPFDDGDPGVGRCRAGRSICTAGEYGLCDEAVGPRDEVDNDQDDDCDGAVDE
ncbi:MAG: Notch-like protein [Bradymonadia bacterium]|jgi:Notch-like protein